ncbi:MAG: AMP-binding protein [Betaproteobacteria bacterium]|nr:AMP-binding protein [Betaproteobacteria bacterium]
MLELATLVNRNAFYRPQGLAVVFEDERYTWAEFAGRVARCANVLRGLGIGPGDKVATVLPNCRELLDLYWAVPSIGAVLVPLSPLLLPAGLASLLADSDARCLVSNEAMLPVLERIPEALAPLLPGRLLLTKSQSPRHGAQFGDYASLTAAAADRFTPAAVGPDAPYNIMYTSGTTGLPKGIVHTHFIRSMYCLMLGAAWRMTPESVALHSGAIVFNGAFVTLMPSFYLGGTYILQRAFDAGRMIETIAREKVTHVMLVPAQVVALLNDPAYAPVKLASLRCLVSLGAPLMQECKDRLNRDLPGRFHELYGLTEGFVTILDRNDAVRKAGSVGVPMPFNHIRIVREDGTDAATGETGEIVGRGPMLMTGYYKRPDLTAQAVREGWLHSGDMGYLDDEGFLYLVDRKKDMIDSGGVKVYPRDIEEIVARHPAVREAAVFGVPDEKWGETPLAAVVLRAPGAASADELRDWINARVGARYQRVSAVTILDDFPRSAAGKTLKRELREPYWAGRERKI